MTREELEHIIRASGDITDQYEFVIVGSQSILGAVPLLLGTDENAALRAPLGITIIGGLILSQVLTLYTTPVVYLYLDRLHRRLRPARLDATPNEAPPA